MKTRLLLALGSIGLAVTGWVALYSWVHRAELFEVPAAWRSILEARRGNEDLSLALTRLIRLQEPEFEGGVRFTLERVRSREGGVVWLVCYEASRSADAPGYAEYGGDFWNYEFFEHRLLCRGGRLIRPALEFFMRHAESARHHVVHDARFDRIVVSDEHPNAPCEYALSIDRRGFVPHGFLGPHEPAASFSFEPEKPESLDVGEAHRLLRSALPGDLLRGLLLMELCDADIEEARWLYDHPDAWVRARAVAVLGEADRRTDRLRGLLDDPVPEVRLAAFYKLAERRDWERDALKLVHDPVPAIRDVAHWYLTRSEDISLARRSAIHLVDARSVYALFDPHDRWRGIDYRRLSSRELALAILRALEEEADWMCRDEDGVGFAEQLEGELDRLRPEHIRPFLPRLLKLHEQLASRAAAWGLWGAVNSLLRQETTACDKRITPRLRLELRDALSHNSPVADALLARTTPVAPLIPDLERLDRMWEREPEEGEKVLEGQVVSYAMWLLAKWNAPRARERLAERLRARNDGKVPVDVFLDPYLTIDLRRSLRALGIRLVALSDPVGPLGEAR